jgi:uncharacterized repeat protein (TIGR01451 family)
LVYAILRSTNNLYATCFHDVTAGDNTWPGSPNQFFAVTGYDLCTGVGTPNGTALINTLTATNTIPFVFIGTPTIPAPPQPWGATLSVMDGANPNGLWLLYFQDDTLNNLSGTNYNGWAVNLTSANPVGFAGDNQLSDNTTVNSQAFGNATNILATPGAAWQTIIAVTNYGPTISSNVSVFDYLPAAPGVSLVSFNASVGTVNVTNSGTALIWQVTTASPLADDFGVLRTNILPIGSGATLTLNFLVNNTGLYSNSAAVSASITDPNPDDNSVMTIASSVASVPPTITPHLMLGTSHALQLSITNDAGANIIIQASTNLVTWVPIITNIAPYTFTVYDTTNYPRRFYRALTGQ